MFACGVCNTAVVIDCTFRQYKGKKKIKNSEQLPKAAALKPGIFQWLITLGSGMEKYLI